MIFIPSIRCQSLKRLRRLCGALSLLLCTAGMAADTGTAAPGSLALDENEYMEVWADPTSTATPEQVLEHLRGGHFQPFANYTDPHMPGRKLTTYWLTFAIDNTSSTVVRRMLEVPVPDTDWVDLYRYESTGTVSHVGASGSAMPFAARSYASRLPVVELEVPPQDSVQFLVRISTGNWPNLHLTLWEKSAFQAHERMSYGLQFGLLAMYLTVCAAFVYFYPMLPDKAYCVAFAAHALTLTAYHLFHEGLAKQYIFPQAGDIQRHAYTMAFGMTVVTGIYFLLYFFRVAATYPRVARLIQAAAWIMLAFLMWNMLLPGAAPTVILILASTAFVGILLVLLFAAAPRVESGGLVLLALGILVLGVIVHVLTRSTASVNHPLIANALQIAQGVYLMINSAAVTQRIRVIVRTHEEMHATALATQRDAVDELEDREQRLAQEIQRRTHDLTEATHQLARAVARAEKANQQRSHFLAMMSHEIRTPLNAVLGMNHLASHYSMDRRARKYIEKSMAAADTLLSLVNEIFDLPAIETGGMVLRIQTFDLRELLEAIRNTLSDAAARKGLQFHVHGALMLPERVVGDADRITQALVNLLGNAVKFTEEGSVSLNVTLVEQDAGTVLLCFSVQDTGIGITDSQMAQLFERFNQADSSIGRRFGGSGLGLVITKGLIERMGGSIQVESQPDQGTRFDISLRLGLPKEGNVDTSDASAPTASDIMGLSGGDLTAWAGLQILLVEDNAWNREYAQGIMAALGVVTHVAENGQRALEVLRDQPRIRVVLMDCHMPVMDGFAAARRIRAIPGMAQLPVIALTADVVGDVRARVIDAGMNDLMFKPYTMHDLIRMLQRWAPQRPSVGAGAVASATVDIAV